MTGKFIFPTVLKEWSFRLFHKNGMLTSYVTYCMYTYIRTANNTNATSGPDSLQDLPVLFPPDCVVGGSTDHVLSFVLQASNPSAVTVKSADKFTCGGFPNLIAGVCKRGTYWSKIK